MRYPLNLVLENWEYLWSYLTFWVEIMDDDFFLKNFVGHMSIFGATDTPVSDFWWCLLWVSKPEWVLPYSNFAEAYVIYIPWDSPLVQHLCRCI